jgi:hypothetical protein
LHATSDTATAISCAGIVGPENRRSDIAVMGEAWWNPFFFVPVDHAPNAAVAFPLLRNSSYDSPLIGAAIRAGLD